MAIRNSRDKSRLNDSSSASPVEHGDGVARSRKDKAQKAFRRTLIETLESRNLMAAGPQLIGVQPNNSDLIENGVVRDIAPRELTFRFDDSQIIDAASTNGIRLTRSGGDGTFGLASAATDFGSNGRVDVQLTMRNPGQTLTVVTTTSDRGNQGPLLAISGATLSIVLNSNAASPTTAAQLVNAINSTANVSNVLSAKINGGFADTKLGLIPSSSVPAVTISATNDTIVRPGSVLVGSAPNQNEVTLRFAESLSDDFYRIEVFGFDDAASGVVGLRNVAVGGMASELFQPSVPGTRQDTIDFRLDLGSKVTGVVPQPVVRNANNSISQLRDTIVVYFDSDKLLVENDATGKPTARSAENPDFYQLIYTADTVRNTDDVAYKPTEVRYNASNNTATLTFGQDIDTLRPAGAARSAFRLRIGTRESTPFTPVSRTVAELGDTFTTADNLGVIGSNTTPLTSVVLSSEIKSTTLGLDRLGASDDPGHRDLGATGFENHINELFGADRNPGITQVFYNFRVDYASGFTNSISERQKERVREALQIWSNYLGVQFIESASQGITFSTGVLNAIPLFGPPTPGVTVQNEQAQFNFRARIDSAFNNSLLVMDAGRAWNDNYGEDYFRISMTAIGMLLGLEHAGDLPESTLLSMNSNFLNAAPNATGAAVVNFEPIFPGAQDVLHGRFIHRPDNSDIDLYRFEIDFGANGASRFGEFVAETFAERSTAVSSLDTNLRLFKQKQATAVSNFNAVEDLAIQFTAKAPGQLGNHLQIVVTQSPRGNGVSPAISVSPNLIAIELNSTVGSETTAGELVAAIQSNSQANALVQVTKLRGADSIRLGSREIVYSPINLLGGKLELIAQNDDYFSEDSLLRLSLDSGVYYVGVSASGNNSYDPAIPNSGTGGRTDGTYDLRMTFRAQTDSNDTIQDTTGQSLGDVGRSLDGDGDGIVGGVFNFWFETRSLDRVLSVNNSGSVLDQQVISITGNSGVIRRFELTTDASVGSGNIPVSFTLASTPAQIATALATAINGQATLAVSATANGSRITLVGDRTIQFQTGASGIVAEGKMVFVDKLAGPNADGSLARPFNNIQNAGVPNAFGSALPGDIVRIVGNGGSDGSISTVVDNFAYEFGFSLLSGAALTDGIALEVPKGVIAMVDAGAVFKSRRSYIAVGSSNTGIDRSGSNLQVLGTPLQPVYFTSWLDETIGRDSYGPSTNPANGDWGGIIYQRDVDRSQGRLDKEDQGIFLNYVNHADMRYGGGGGIIIDSAQQVVNPIQVIDGRPTLTFNTITRSADAALSATPNSFEETLFTDLRFQSNGSFTPDYDRVGPSIHGNRLVNNSLNGLFIKVQTLPGEAPRSVTLAARFDDIDVTHILTENLLIQGTPGGSLLDATKPDTTFLTLNELTGGSIPAGSYNYRVAFVDRFGVESVPSDASSSQTLASSGSIEVNGLPALGSGFAFVRLYRSDATGAGPYTLVAQLDSTQNSFIDRGQDQGGRLAIPATPASAALRPRLDASLVVDPGSVVKLEGARIELGQGVQFLAEGTQDLPIVFTSKLDDRSGAGGTFDTNNDGTNPSPSIPAPGNWGGIYVSSGADASIDHSLIAYAGGVTRLDGTFRSFNALELQQGTARVANSTFEFNANGVGGQGPVDRFGRLNNEQAVVYARGTSPIFVNNVFQNNSTNATGLTRSSAITIDANSLNNDLQGDRGRQSGLADRITTLDYNRGPLFRGNSFSFNDLNGLKVRADNRSRNTATGTLSIDDLSSDGLTVESVWDDTDIVHVLYEGIFVSNLAHASGLRLQSSPTESLVVKVSGGGSNFDPLRGSGFTAGGFTSSINDRVGGTIHVVGQPGFPVVITSLQDDTVGAGLRPDGTPQTDTNNDGIATIPRPGDWRGILLDQDSNDRNVQIVLETEAPNSVAPGVNGTVISAQVLGQLAANANNSDENLRLGFVVKGILSQPEDVDVYSFTGVGGTEVWIDIDHTAYTLDTVVELLDANGNLLARSDNSTTETADSSSIVVTGGISASRVNPLAKQTAGNVRRNADNSLKEDGTTNPRDAGFRIILPGAANTRSGYFFRVRSASINPGNAAAGLTGGSYEVQVRLREAQEFAGSSITGADIRYATNGIHVRGLPGHSPLLGEASEDEAVRNGAANANNDLPWSYKQNGFTGFISDRPVSTGNRPQYVGNILDSDRGVISIAGNLGASSTFLTEADFYRFSLTEQDLVNNVNSVANLVFDMDFADGLNRADTNLSVYRLGGTPGLETWQLIYFGEGSNIFDDQRAPLSGSTAPDFSRGSFGTNDPFINTQPLTAGDYLVAITGANSIPSEFASTSSRSDSVPVSIDLDVGQTFAYDLTTALVTENHRVEFFFQNMPTGGNGYQFQVNGVDTSLRGTGFFSLDLTPFIGSPLPLVTITFPTLAIPDSPIQPSITRYVKRSDLPSGSAERTPFTRVSTPQLDNLLVNPLSIATRQEIAVDLSNYAATDLPAAYFNYATFANDYTITIESSLGIDAPVFASGPLVLDGINRQAKIDLQRYAGLSNVRLVFTPTGLNPSATVNRVMIGFAERGESIVAPVRNQRDFDASSGGVILPVDSRLLQPLFIPNPIQSATQQAGDYQLEIRRVDSPTLTDSNDRDASGFAILVPSGAAISDSQFFTISDGANSVDFEFNSTGSVSSGRVPINFVASPVPDSATVIAQRIRDAINSAGVQSRLGVQAAGAGGQTSGLQTGNRLNLVGAARVSGFFNQASNNLLVFSSNGDLNSNRDQGQVIITGNVIRHSRDYGVWSEAGLADFDPRDLVDTYSSAGNLIDAGTTRVNTAIIQSRPRTVGSAPGPVRNLQELNDDLIGGFATGVVITNNILENGGLGGAHVAGENPIWMITPFAIPSTDHLNGNETGTHFGSFVNDGDQFFIDAGRTRVGLEFEDIAGAPTGAPNFGSGQTGGDGWRDTNVPVYYREDQGSAYLRSTTAAWGYSALETVHALRDAVLGSILVTNGTTQNVTATVAMSLLNPNSILFSDVPGPQPNTPTFFDARGITLSNNSGLNWANRPALYLEGVTNLYYRGERGGNPWTIARVDRAETPQAFARIVNNTIIGNDGRASFTVDTNNGTNTAVNEPNDLLSNAIQTQQGTSINPQSFTIAGQIGDNGALINPSSDVDLYQFKLDIGDRVRIDIDTDPANSPVDTVLQIYDSNGRLVNLAARNVLPFTSVDDAFAPGEVAGVDPATDPYVDFTATVPGVYYAAVSAKGNVGFDPQSSASRIPGSGTGRYRINLAVAQPQEFTITVEDPSQIAEGDTFIIYQVSDLPNNAGNSRTFEFTFNANYNGNNVPIFIGPDYRIPDVARAIAISINAAGLTNNQGLSNGTFGAANPLDAVTAEALGGADGVQPGLRLFPFRSDGFFANPQKHSSGGIGHNRTAAQNGNGSEAFGTAPFRADGAGTSEKFVIVRNAAAIDSNGGVIRVDPDMTIDYNMNQLIPESGVLMSAGASPTVLNNAFYNVQTPIVREETRSLPNVADPFDQDPLPFGSPAPGGADRNAKPSEIIVGGNVYQFIETQTAFNRNGYGVQASPTNVPNTQADFNFIALNGDQLFVNPQAGQYLPAPGSRLIDSSIDSLTERDKFNSIKSAAGIAPSPVLAPSRDAFGQLRVDDPDVAPPQGLGSNIFKDRGALDRADFTGPTVRLLRPIDNDSELLDRDPSVSFVQLSDGTYPEFRLQLSDTGDAADPFPGVGVDDDSVLGPDQSPLRLPGAVLTITEDGRTLREGIDYVFAYNPTTKEIVLTPLAGVWRNNRVYEIKLNNRDRFVVQSPAGDQVSDEYRFSITDDRGGVVQFEFDSGYRLQLPTSLRLLLPSSGGGPGGILDGDQFTITVGTVTKTFEMDRNSNINSNNIGVAFLATDSQSQLADKILAAILSNNAGLGLIPRILSDGSVFLGASDGATIGITGTAFSVPVSTTGLKVPKEGPLPGGIEDRQTFSISDGARAIIFEIDADGQLTNNAHVRVDISTANTAAAVAQAIFQAVSGSPLAIKPKYNVGSDSVELGLPSNGSVNVTPPAPLVPSRLSIVGFSRTIADGTSIDVQYQPDVGALVRKTFEFDSNNTLVNPNSTRIAISDALTESDLGVLLAETIRSAGLSLNDSSHLGGGNVFIGGTPQHVVSLSGGALIELIGKPGVGNATSLMLQEALVLVVAATGGAGILDSSTFTLIDSLGVSKTFEFDSNNALSNPGSGNIRVPYLGSSTATDIAAQIATAIAGSGLSISAVDLLNGQLELGFLTDAQVVVQASTSLTTRRKPIGDGEFFTIDNGVTPPVTFEFDNTTLSNGSTAGRIPIRFSRNLATNSGDSLAQIAALTETAIENSGVGLFGKVTLSGEVLSISDDPRFVYTVTGAPSIRLDGVPGGVYAIPFKPDATFTGNNMQAAIVKAINRARDAGATTLSAIIRANDSFFVDRAITVTTLTPQLQLPNYFLRGIQDLADNELRPNTINNETLFTILMPGSSLDFGDAPDPYTTTSGRYPTQFSSNGARHVVTGEDEIQVVGWTAGDPVIGTFTLSHGGVTTAVLSTTATAAQVQSALEGLSTIGTGNVLVEVLEQPSGSPNVSYRLAFRGLRTSLDVPQTTLTLGTLPASATPVSAFEQTIRAGQSGLRLGRLIDADSDGRPTVDADGDSGDDGVTFSTTIVQQPGLPAAAFNRNVTTVVTVTASSPGLLDAWIDFNFDGDWDDPNEQIASSFEFLAGSLTQSFNVQVPANTPAPSSPTRTMARFRLSTDGGLLPTGLATNGEVEDYAVTIVPGSPPLAVNDSYTMLEDSIGGLVVSNLEGILINDTDIDSPTRFVVDNDLNTAGIQPFSGPQHGTLTLNLDGSFTYEPQADFFGEDTFVYQASDGVLRSVLNATVTITVRESNDFPVVPDRAKELEKNQVYDVSVAELLSEGSAPPTNIPAASAGPANESNQTLSITRVDSTSANGGTVTFTDGRIRYTPTLDFVGTDSFTFLVTDNGTTNGTPDPRTTTGTIVFNVSDRNSAPVAGPDALSTNEDTAASRPIAFFLGNDVPGGPGEVSQTLTFTSVDPTSTRGGIVTLVGDTITYTPAANFNGTDTFFYTITDNGQTNGTPDPRTARGTVTVTVGSVNDQPQVVNPLGSVTVNEDAADRTFDLKTVFSDVDIATNNDVLTYSIASNSRPTLVATTIGANGILTVDFLSDQNGVANVVVRATDSAGSFVDSTLAITVNAIADAPRLVANIPDQNVQEDAPPIVLAISPNFIFDPDVATNNEVLTITATSDNTGLVTTLVSGGSLRLTMAANQFGQATINVRAVDSLGQEVSDTFLVTVTSVNDAPTVTARSYSVPANGNLVTFDVTGTENSNPNDDGVLAGSIDVEGDAFNAVLVRQPTRGSVLLNANGTFTYTPNAGSQVGQSDTFTFRAIDALGAQSPETTVTVNFGALTASRHQNPSSRFDVNADGFVSPVDALIVINYLSRNGSNIAVETLPYQPAPYRDVNGDYFLSPIDVLQVINELNRRSRSGSGEGESAQSGPIIVSPNATGSTQGWQVQVSPGTWNRWVAMEPQPIAVQQAPISALEVAMEELSDAIHGANEIAENIIGSEPVSGGAVDAAMVDFFGSEIKRR